MCLGIPARVLAVDGAHATIDLRGTPVQADATMVPVRPGDYVLVYAGLVVQVLDAQEAEDRLRDLDEIGRSAEVS